jgi:flagellar hook-associated protein 2
VITQQPTKGLLVADAVVSTFPLDTTGKTYTFTAAVDGVTADPITLPTTTYATGAALAADIQTRINSDAKITAGKVSVSVAFNTLTNKLEFTSNAYGSSSNVSILAPSTDMADLGVSAAIGTAGTDVAGTVGGVTAFGFGDVLLPAIGSKAEGLSMRVTPGATSGNITFSRGFAGTFTSLINNFLKTNGLIKNHEKEITQQVDKVKLAQTALDKRSEAYRARLQAQFSAMESIVRGLKSTGTFLTGAFKALSGSSDD